jgi:Chromo shadow domain
MKIRSFHGLKESKKYLEIMCTVEWKKIDPARKYAPLDSMVTYAEMRKEKPELVCQFYEDRITYS